VDHPVQIRQILAANRGVEKVLVDDFFDFFLFLKNLKFCIFWCFLRENIAIFGFLTRKSMFLLCRCF